MNRIRALIAILAIAAGTAAVPWSTVTAQSPRCILVSYAHQTCYLASQVNQALRRMPVQPVNPTPVIKAVTHLDMSQVSVTGINPSPNAIHFIYGWVPGHMPLSPTVAPPNPRYVIVTEALGHVTHPGMSVVNQGGEPRGPWYLTANLPLHPRLRLAIRSNLGTAAIRRMAREIMQKGRQTSTYGPPTIQELAARGMIFTPLTPVTGSITPAQAIAKARAWAPGVSNSGQVSTVARFGRFTDLHYQHGNSLVIKDRLVWLVTFFGPGVSISAVGPCCGSQPHPVHHSISVVIDASTGEALMGFS